MRNRSCRWGVAALSLLSVAWVGCAVEEDTAERSRFEEDGVQVGVGGAGVGGQSTVSGGNGAGSTGAGGASTAVTTGAGAGPNCDYDSPNSCLSADTITEIAGDAGTDVRVIRGTTSRFIKVFVAETVSSVFSYPDLKFAAHLANSPGMDFDLNAYVADTQPHCNGQLTSATSEPAVVAGVWNDSLNSDDGRWMVFEVAYAGGSSCDSAAEWTLTIAGNYEIRCDTNGICDAGDDCVCPDCDADTACMDPGSCDDDDFCDTESEGCGCNDCQGTPACL